MLRFKMKATYQGEVDVESNIPGDSSVTFKLAEIRHYTQDFKDLIGSGNRGIYRGVISGRVGNEILNSKEIAVKACFNGGAIRKLWKFTYSSSIESIEASLAIQYFVTNSTRDDPSINLVS